jgi:glyoxylase-like metal-dependent hydrolase (beta-lactamase superfamily II)
MGWSTTVVTPPDGDMACYLASLDVIQQRDFATLWPTHGPPITAPRPFIDAYRAHRMDRERQILAQLGAGQSKIRDMVPAMYVGVDARLYPAAARSVHAHMIQLVRQGRVVTDGAAELEADYRLA